MGWRAEAVLLGEGKKGRSHANPCKSCSSCLLNRPIFRPQHRRAAEPKHQYRCSTRQHRETLVHRDAGPHPPLPLSRSWQPGVRPQGSGGLTHHAQAPLRITPSQEGTSQPDRGPPQGVTSYLGTWSLRRSTSASTSGHVICDSCYCGIRSRDQRLLIYA